MLQHAAGFADDPALRKSDELQVGKQLRAGLRIQQGQQPVLPDRMDRAAKPPREQGDVVLPHLREIPREFGSAVIGEVVLQQGHRGAVRRIASGLATCGPGKRLPGDVDSA